MKKITTSLIFLLACNFYSLAQSDISTKEEKSNTHEIGINSTFFIKQFLNFVSSSNIETSPFLLTYKRINKENIAFRFGIGMDIDANKSIDNGTTIISSLSSVSYRIGGEKQFPLKKRWLSYVGADFINSIDNRRTKTTNDGNEFISNALDLGFGVGPVGGIQFNINNRLSLATESSFVLEIVHSTESFKNSDNPNPNSSSEETSFKAHFILPTTLYFIVNF